MGRQTADFHSSLYLFIGKITDWYIGYVFLKKLRHGNMEPCTDFFKCRNGRLIILLEQGIQ